MSYRGIKIDAKLRRVPEKNRLGQESLRLKRLIPKLKEILSLIPAHEQFAQKEIADTIHAIENDDIDALHGIFEILVLADSPTSPFSAEQKSWIASLSIIIGMHHDDRSSSLLTKLPEGEIEKLTNYFADFVSKGSEEERLLRIEFLQMLFSNDSDMTDKQLSDILSNVNTQSGRNETTRHPALNKIFEMVMRYPWQFSYECTFLGNTIGGRAVEALRQAFRPEKIDAMTVSLHFQSWYLCSTSEYKLMSAADKGLMTLAVDSTGEPAIAIKLVGKFAGLTLKSIESGNGVVIPVGTWVSPTDNPTRQRIRESFDNGNLHLDLRQPSQWAVMRGVAEDNIDDTQETQQSGKEVVFWKKIDAAVRNLPPETVDKPKTNVAQRLYAEVRKLWRQDHVETDN